MPTTRSATNTPVKAPQELYNTDTPHPNTGRRTSPAKRVPQARAKDDSSSTVSSTTSSSRASSTTSSSTSKKTAPQAQAITKTYDTAMTVFAVVAVVGFLGNMALEFLPQNKMDHLGSHVPDLLTSISPTYLIGGAVIATSAIALAAWKWTHKPQTT